MIDVLPATSAFVVAPSDTVNFVKRAKKLYVATGGTLTIVDGAGTAVSLGTVPANFTLSDVEIKRVNLTGTSATGIVGFA